MLSGTLPSQLGTLSSLQTINMDDNNLHGTIPHELGNLAKLQDIFLYSNRLTGSIPSTFCKLAFLQDLRIGDMNVCYPSCIRSVLPSIELKEGNMTRCPELVDTSLCEFINSTNIAQVMTSSVFSSNVFERESSHPADISLDSITCKEIYQADTTQYSLKYSISGPRPNDIHGEMTLYYVSILA
jgi:hypothetical protein